MTAVPEPCYEIRAARMRETAALVRQASALTEHGLRLFAGTVISYADPAVRRAVKAGLGGAEAGQGLTRRPREAVTGPEPAYAENWFCSSCLSLRVGGRTADGVCAGCRCGRCGAGGASVRLAGGLCGACRITEAAEDAGLRDDPAGDAS